MAKRMDDIGFEIFEKGHGKKQNQKLKPYLVLQYLLKKTDENHVVSAENIVGYLQETCGIYAERRSIYRDIEEINKAMLVVEEEVDVHMAEDMLAESDELKLVVYDKHRKGFYVRQRHYDLQDIRLLAESVYAAKFLSKGQADRLADVVCSFASEYQAEKIRHNAFLTDRVKTSNRAVLNSISTINEAMSKELDGIPHKPEKISFKYLKYSIGDMSQQVERKQGKKYVVSPFKLLINDGNYYLLSFDDEAQEMRTYRVDRMKGVERTGQPREGDEVFKEIDLKTYTKRVFSMFGGREERVTILFANNLLDAVVDRFGNDKSTVFYARHDDDHFTVTTQVEISNQFYGWVLGFGEDAKILRSEAVVEEFKAYLDKVRELY